VKRRKSPAWASETVFPVAASAGEAGTGVSTELTRLRRSLRSTCLGAVTTGVASGAADGLAGISALLALLAGGKGIGTGAGAGVGATTGCGVCCATVGDLTGGVVLCGLGVSIHNPKAVSSATPTRNTERG